jgi:Flp pilus assembly protein TadD
VNLPIILRRLFLIVLLASLFTGLLAGCREMAEKEAGNKMDRAEEALLEENWEQADELFYEALLLDQERAEAWIGRGMTQTKLGDPEYARKHYNTALGLIEKRLEENPLAPDLLRGQIMLLVLLNRSSEARSVAEEAALVHPNEAVATQLVPLVDRLHRDFQEMILPPEKRPEEHGDETETAAEPKGSS